MKLNTRILSSAAAVAITCAVSAAAYYYRSRNAEINEVMVFCKLQLNAYNYFDKLVSYIEAAKKTVNICMPSIHNPAIQGRLVNLIKKKNIKVRMIIDHTGYNESTDFFINELIEAGAEIKYKVNRTMYKMQHKFCLVDDKVLMTGTLDWGNDHSADNWNYVYITNKQQLVEPVKTEFYEMWGSYSFDVLPIRKPSPTETENSEDHISCVSSDTEIVENSNSGTIDAEAWEDLDPTTQQESTMTPELL